MKLATMNYCFQSGGSGGGVQQLQLAEGRSQREWLEFFHVNLKK